MLADLAAGVDFLQGLLLAAESLLVAAAAGSQFFRCLSELAALLLLSIEDASASSQQNERVTDISGRERPRVHFQQRRAAAPLAAGGNVGQAPRAAAVQLLDVRMRTEVRPGQGAERCRCLPVAFRVGVGDYEVDARSMADLQVRACRRDLHPYGVRGCWDLIRVGEHAHHISDGRGWVAG